MNFSECNFWKLTFLKSIISKFIKKFSELNEILYCKDYIHFLLLKIFRYYVRSPKTFGWKDIAQSSDQMPFLPSSDTFLGRFLLHIIVLSDQMGSGNSKDSYRKLRVYTFISKILVNECWPFRQHTSTFINCISGKLPLFGCW